MQPKNSVVDVWLADTAHLSPDFSGLSAAEEQIYRQRQLRAGRVAGHTFAVSRAMRRALLSARAGGRPCAWCFSTTDKGKPYLTGGPDTSLATSLSHTGTWVACAATHNSHLGLDIEYLNRFDQAPHRTQVLAQRFFSHQETSAQAQLVSPMAQAHAFVRRWTQKEATLKAWGGGLGDDLKAVSFSLCKPGWVTLPGSGVNQSLMTHTACHPKFLSDLHCLAVDLKKHMQETLSVPRSVPHLPGWPGLCLAVALGRQVTTSASGVAINIYCPTIHHINHCLHPPVEVTLAI